MNMIAQILGHFLKSLSEIVAPDAFSDFGSKMAKVLEVGHTMLLETIVCFFQDMDDDIARNPQRIEGWEIVRKDKRTLTTAFGDLCFERRYYRNKQTGEMAYLLDRHLGIQAGAKVNGDVRQKAVTLAEQGSYAKGAAASTVSPISRMSVCNYVGDLEHFPALEAQGEKRSVKQLYVEADEDHVSLQNGKKTQVKLVYIHEGLEDRGGRRTLVNPRYLTCPSQQDNDTLWETVSRYIDRQYASEDIKEIFLSGDCASWIRTGEEWLYPCVPVLDSFHMMKALRELFGGRQDQAAAFLRHVRKDERDQAGALCKSILRETPESKQGAKAKRAAYLLNNWQRIRNQRHPGAQGCSAEGHVSHILSDRLSSRPLGWSMRNMENIAQLRVMSANGQAVQYEALRRTASCHGITGAKSQADALVSTPGMRETLKKSTQSTMKTTMQNLPVLKNGATTSLYQALHNLSFDFLAC